MSIFKRSQDPPYGQRTPAVGGSSSYDKSSSASSVTARPMTGSTPAPAVASTPAPAPDPAATVEPPPAITGASDDLRNNAAVLDNKTQITGTLHSDGNVLIEGVFHGEVEARETVWVETGAQSQGQIRAHDVVIFGTVDGEIACEHRLQIAASAVVTGEIKTPVLVIEEGATINCRFIMERTGREAR